MSEQPIKPPVKPVKSPAPEAGPAPIAAPSPAINSYIPSRCPAVFVVWISGNQLRCAPVGWRFVRQAAGQYWLYPSAGDVPDPSQAIGVSGICLAPSGSAAAQAAPDARTFVFRWVTDHFEVLVYMESTNYADVDCAFMVFVPGVWAATV